jgi:hypothetical protein
MSILNVPNTDKSRLVFEKDHTRLYITAESDFICIGPAGEERISPKAAAEWSGFEPGDPEFYKWVHNYVCTPYGLKPDDQAFLELKKIKIRERVQELQKLPPFNLCVVEGNSRLKFVQLGSEDHDEILRMFDQEPQALGHDGNQGDFVAILNGPFDFLGGDIIAHDYNRYHLIFWHAQKCDFQSGTKMTGKLPHVWVSIYGNDSAELPDSRLVAHYSVKAILSFIVLHEAYYGREPETCGLMEKPRDPSFVIR